jgi:hypothetical protein
MTWRNSVDGLFLAGLGMRTDVDGEIICCKPNLTGREKK